jgi:hypothetical protein
LKTNELANSSSAFSARPSRSTTPLTIEPKTLIGEKPPAVAPLMTMSPIRSGLIPYWSAKPMPIGTMMATAPGTTAPEAVKTAVMRKNTHGMAAVRPPTALTEAWISQSTVPLLDAIPNRNVTPTRITNRSPGKPAKMSSSETPSAVPSANAATMPSTPMLIPIVVPMRKMTMRTMIEMSSLDMLSPGGRYSAARTSSTGWRARSPTPWAICWRQDTPVAATRAPASAARNAGNRRDSPTCMDSS